MKFNTVNRTEMYVELIGDNDYKMLMPSNATVFVDEDDSLSIKTTASRKTVGYKTK